MWNTIFCKLFVWFASSLTHIHRYKIQQLKQNNVILMEIKHKISENYNYNKKISMISLIELSLSNYSNLENVVYTYPVEKEITYLLLNSRDSIFFV